MINSSDPLPNWISYRERLPALSGHDDLPSPVTMSIELAPLIRRTKQITLTLRKELEQSSPSLATKFSIVLTVEDAAHDEY